jgi:diacylglycerol kinase (ATP)
MLILVNPKAAGSTALRKWEKVSWRLLRSLEHPRVQILDGAASTGEQVREALLGGERDFIAAGGDGTLNVLLNAMLEHATEEQLPQLRIGAVGIGSSNDFHKPVTGSNLIDGIPCRVDLTRATPRDVGRLTWREGGTLSKKYFLSNASIGVTAEANSFFNNPDRLLGALKACSTPAAILYAALRTILRHRAQRCALWSPATGGVTTGCSNLAILKSPYISGSLRFDSPALYDSGLFSVYLASDMTTFDLLRLLRSLGAGRNGDSSPALRKVRSWNTPSLLIRSEHPFTVEYDGEILRASEAEFSVLPCLIKVCP